MEKYFVKMQKEHPESGAGVKRLLTYIAGKGTNRERESAVSVRGYGVSNNYKKASEQMLKIQRLYEKDKGRKGYHMIVSFENKIDDVNFVILAADAVACMIFEEMHYQVFYGVHTSTDNLHIHFAISAVNYKSGKKWHQDKHEFLEFKAGVSEIINSVV